MILIVAGRFYRRSPVAVGGFAVLALAGVLVLPGWGTG